MLQEMWSQHVNGFETLLKENSKTPTTITAYLGDIKQFFEYLRKKKIRDIEVVEPTNIQDFLKTLRAKNYSIKSVSRKLNTIRTFFRLRKEAGESASDPSVSIHHPKIQTKAPRILTETEYMALKEACRPNLRLFAVVEMLLQTGMKIGELCRLALDDIKYHGKKPVELWINEYHNSKGRWVPLNQKVAEALIMYFKIRPETKSDILFVSSKGHPARIRNLRSYIMAAFRKAAIKNAKVNDLRNTFIVQQLKRGTSLVAVSQFVGHKRLSTTEKYLEMVEREEESPPQLPEL